MLVKNFGRKVLVLKYNLKEFLDVLSKGFKWQGLALYPNWFMKTKRQDVI